MARIISCTAPHHKTWRLLVLGTLLIGLLLAQPLVARADGNEKESFTTTAAILIADPGNVMPLGNSGKLRTTGELIIGCISSSTWIAIPVVGPSCSPFATPNLTVDHSSMTTISPTGQISGDGLGTFSVGAFQGRYKGDILAQLIGLNTIGWIQDSGTWNAADGSGNTARGTFDLRMDWNGVTLVGTLTLNGVHTSHE